MSNAAIRVDASPRIGTGHVMRCLALAQALGDAGWRASFVCRHLPAILRAMVRDAGHELIELAPAHACAPTDGLAHSEWLGASQAADASATLDSLSGRPWEWLVVDHYALDARWESALRPTVGRILAIDDIADRPHDCDALLDQNLFPSMQSRYDGKTPAGCRLLLGPRYALLRKEFAELRARARLRDGLVARMLILMGGMDTQDATAKAMRAVARIPRRSFEVDVAVGGEHPSLDAMRTACAELGYRCHVQPASVGALMMDADVAIGGCGATSWERCCLGLPTIGMALADNQAAIAHGLAAAGAIVDLGDAARVTEHDVLAALLGLLNDPERLRRLSAAALVLVDGEGASRVRDFMVGAT